VWRYARVWICLKRAVSDAIKGILDKRKASDIWEEVTMVSKRLGPGSQRTPVEECGIELTVAPARKPASRTAASLFYSASWYKNLNPDSLLDFEDLVKGWGQRLVDAK
jgi:hypothetical protein